MMEKMIRKPQEAGVPGSCNRHEEALAVNVMPKFFIW